MNSVTWNADSALELPPQGIDLLAMEPDASDSGAFKSGDSTTAEKRMDFEPSYEPPLEGVAEICLYRKRTIRLLRRYARLYVETSRLPSVLCGMEFQGHISSYPLNTFEDAVIFVWDIERCLGELSEFEYEVVARVILRKGTIWRIGSTHII